MTIKEMIIRQARELNESAADISDERMWLNELEYLKGDHPVVAEFAEKFADWETKDVGSRATLLISKIISTKPNEPAFGGDLECAGLIRLCAYIVSACMYDECIATLVEPIDTILYCSKDGEMAYSISDKAKAAYNEDVSKRISAIMYILHLICSGALEDQEFLNDIAGIMLGEDIDDPEAMLDILEYGDDEVQTVVDEPNEPSGDLLTVESLGDISHI